MIRVNTESQCLKKKNDANEITRLAFTPGSKSGRTLERMSLVVIREYYKYSEPFTLDASSNHLMFSNIFIPLLHCAFAIF